MKLKQVLEENGILKEVDTFYCSPLTRALKTCDLLLSETNANKNVYVFEHLRERIGGNPCDGKILFVYLKTTIKIYYYYYYIGRRGTNELKAEFHRFDFKNIEPKDPFPYTLPREEIPELIERSSNVLKRIKHHATSKQVVIVTHSSFLFKGIFAEGLLDCSEFPSASAWFENAEHKSLLIEFKEE